jgi:hypothetical protein
MEERTSTADRGANVARTLARVLIIATEAGRDPWETAELAGNLHGCQGAPLIWANALRWQVAHQLRQMGHRDLAADLVRRELTVNCEDLGGEHAR